MYHLGSNKIIIFDSYLYFKYDYTLDQIFSIIKNSEGNNVLQVTNKLFFTGYYYLKDMKLSKPVNVKLFQSVESYSKLIDNEQLAIKELNLDINKLQKALDNDTNKNLLTLFIEGVNKYFKKNQYLPKKTGLLFSNPDVKKNIENIFNNLKKGNLFNDGTFTSI